jgi:hypothetical protein
MKVNTIANTPEFTLTSWGNGVAYSMVNKKTQQEVYVQCEDAEQFITLYGNFNRELGTERACAAMWNEYDAVASNLGE